MLDQGIIRPSYSPWSAPVWVVPEKLDAEDARKLNMELERVHNENSLSRNDLEGQKLLNNRLIERFGEITEHINKEQEIISETSFPIRIESIKIRKIFQECNI